MSMKQLSLSLLIITLLLIIRAAPAWAAPPVLASGSFDAIVDFSTLSLTPVGNHCLLEVDGTLIFSGTLEGTATGTTRALIFASCPEVQTNPPGTFPDIFKSKLELTDPESGEHITDITYQGKTAVGGEIKALLILSNGLTGTLEVDAIVAEGGDYTGFIKTS